MHTPRQNVEVIGLVGLAHSTSHFFHLILAPLFPWIKIEFGLSYAELGLLMTIFFVVSTIVQATVGFWVDRDGARPVLMTGIGLLAIAAFVLSISNSYFVLMLGAALAGMGNGVFHPSDYTLLNKLVAPKNLGYAYSVHGITGYLGWAAAPIFLGGLATLYNWRIALMSASFLVICIFILLWVRREALHDHPKGEQLVEKSSNHPLAFLKLPTIWMCWGFFFLSTLALAGIQSFSPSALQSIYGVDLALTTTAYTFYMLASAGGMLVGGLAVSRISKPDRIITFAFLSSGFFAVIAGLGIFPGEMIPVIFALMGLGSGVAGPSRDLMIRSSTPKGSTGRVYGMVYSGLDVGLSIGPFLFGVLMDHKFPSAVFYLIACFQVLAIFTAIKLTGKSNSLQIQSAT